MPLPPRRIDLKFRIHQRRRDAETDERLRRLRANTEALHKDTAALMKLSRENDAAEAAERVETERLHKQAAESQQRLRERIQAVLKKDDPTTMSNTNTELYERDFVAWTEDTARKIGERRFDEIDLDALKEEIGDMGIARKHALESKLRQLILHLLKLQRQPELTNKHQGWIISIGKERVAIERLLRQNPSLKSYLEEALSNAYPDAVKIAALETGLDEKGFPKQCPYTIDQLRDEFFLPE